MHRAIDGAQAGLTLLRYIGSVRLLAISIRELVAARTVAAICQAILAAINWALAGATTLRYSQTTSAKCRYRAC